ncbi:MAG: hypothetical protein WCI60_00955 [bacterium]
MRNFEFNIESQEIKNHIICENVLDTILDADNIAKSFNDLKQTTGAYVDGYLDVFIGTFMAGDNKVFKLISNDPERISDVKFHGDDEIFKGNFNEYNPLLADTINISLDKNEAGQYESIISLRNKIDEDTEMIVEIAGKDFTEKYTLEFQDRIY